MMDKYHYMTETRGLKTWQQKTKNNGITNNTRLLRLYAINKQFVITHKSLKNFVWLTGISCSPERLNFQATKDCYLLHYCSAGYAVLVIIPAIGKL